MSEIGESQVETSTSRTIKEVGRRPLGFRTAFVPPKNESALAKLDRARQALAEARTLADVKKIRDIAEAARVYAKAAHMGREAQNYAGEVKLLAERKAGDLLGQLNRGKTGPKLPATVAGNSEYSQTLIDTKTPERTAQYWQKVAQVPEKAVHDYITTVHKTDKAEITTAGLLRECRKSNGHVKEEKEFTAEDRIRKVIDFTRRLYEHVPRSERDEELRELATRIVEDL
jgi:hypothetical protein